ncbi:MAG: NAD(P)-dependent glycerol-3-phosphate dehydrogenase [Planctomycetes bacterium]|nr:NAD(P)-dependent glycerol-3-phosphate dehydrogenase [Planctomycetota bacterium]
MPKHVLVLGAGGWGTCLAVHLHRKGLDTRLWGHRPEYVDWLRRYRENTRYLPGVSIPEGIEICAELKPALAGIDYLVMAVPTQVCRSVLIHLVEHVHEGLAVVSVSKGIENETLLRPSDIIKDVLGKVRVAVLSGPSHAEEVARQLPTSLVAASKDDDLARQVQHLFSADSLRVYTNPDMVGVELGGAVKNVIAVAAGICDGLGLGDNAKASLLARGMIEIARLGVALGAKKSTFSGLSGFGDLVTTCVSGFGRNREVGMKIAKGQKLSEILAGTEKVAEGVWTTRSVRTLARKHNVDAPINLEVYRVLFEDKDPAQAVRDLMLRAPKSEAEDLI